jgi:hypothetical protein
MAVPPLTRNCKCRPTAEAIGRFYQRLKSNNRLYLLYQANSFPAGFTGSVRLKNITEILFLCSENDMKRTGGLFCIL